MAIVTVTTTYLQLPSRAHFRPSLIDQPAALVMQAHAPTVDFYRFLYDAVGRDYAWLARKAWSDNQLADYLARPSVSLLVLYLRGTPAGYIELDTAVAEPGTEVAYFGLMPAFHGQGLGKHLLSIGVQRAYDDGAERVWLHTCTLDGPHALANYRARGFEIYKVEQSQEELPDG